MNQDQFEGKWKQMKGAFKEKWGKFTDDDWTRMEGSRDKVVGALQEKYGHTKEQAQREFDDWYNAQGYGENVRTGGGRL
jgi:uncharacterized protein YjbJ (UPF0337 family)